MSLPILIMLVDVLVRTLCTRLQEAERDAVQLDSEPAVAEFLALLQQAAAARAAVRSATFAPQAALPFLQPGRLVRLLTAPDSGERVVIDPSDAPKSSSSNGGAHALWADPAVWGVIINFERVGGAKKGELCAMLHA